MKSEKGSAGFSVILAIQSLARACNLIFTETDGIPPWANRRTEERELMRACAWYSLLLGWPFLSSYWKPLSFCTNTASCLASPVFQSVRSASRITCAV